jgi:hypothetical protein
VTGRGSLNKMSSHSPAVPNTEMLSEYTLTQGPTRSRRGPHSTSGRKLDRSSAEADHRSSRLRVGEELGVRLVTRSCREQRNRRRSAHRPSKAAGSGGGGHRGIIWQKRTRVITPVADTFSSSSVKSMPPVKAQDVMVREPNNNVAIGATTDIDRHGY